SRRGQKAKLRNEELQRAAQSDSSRFEPATAFSPRAESSIHRLVGDSPASSPSFSGRTTSPESSYPSPSVSPLDSSTVCSVEEYSVPLFAPVKASSVGIIETLHSPGEEFVGFNAPPPVFRHYHSLPLPTERRRPLGEDLRPYEEWDLFDRQRRYRVRVA
ncbi:ribokinase, partial [Pseudohyphozyma bogoriensis]